MSNLNQQLISLGSVEKTLIIPLWARAEETLNSGLIDDPMSVEFINKLDTSIFNFNQMSRFVKNYLLTAIANRTILIDQFLNDVLSEDNIVLNFGCGLDTRFSRFRGKVRRWYDIDMPDVIKIKQNFVQENDSYKLIPASIFDDNLFGKFDLDGRVIAICEGVLMYFDEKEVRAFLSKLMQVTKEGDLIIETLGNLAKLKVNPVIKDIGESSRYIWTINEPEKLQIDNMLRTVKSSTIFDLSQERWGLYGKLMKWKFLNKRVSDKITHYRYKCQ